MHCWDNMNYVNSQERIGIISHTIPERYDWANYTRDIFNPFKIVTSVNDDAVSVGVKSLCMYSSVSLILWLLSLVLVVVQRVENDHFSRIDALLFLPMWVGSVLGVTSSILIAVRVCSNATLVSRERRMFMRVQGTETENQFIDYESLPLMRQLFCWTLVLGLFFTFSLIAQILFYFWYIDASIGLWDALIPVCVLVAVYLIYLYSVEVFSILSCVVFSLITLELVSRK